MAQYRHREHSYRSAGGPRCGGQDDARRGAARARPARSRAAGSVERGTTVSDFDPLEKTVPAFAARVARASRHAATRASTSIDTPGLPDFIGQAIGALDAVETAAVVVNAQNGIEMITSRMMEWAAKRKLCRLIIVNKIDAENVDLPSVLAAIQAAFGKECLPINLPADGGKRVVDCFFNPVGRCGLLVGGRRAPGARRPGGRGRRGADGAVPRAGRESRPSSCTRRSRRRCAKAISCRSASCRRAPAPASPSCSTIFVKLAPNPDRGQSAAVHQGRRRRARAEFRSEPDPEEARARARVQGRDRSVRRQARRLPRAPGHDHARTRSSSSATAASRSRSGTCSCCRAARTSRSTARCPATSPRSRRSTRSSSTPCCTTRTTRTTSTCGRSSSRRRCTASRSSRSGAATSSASPTSCTR